MDFVLGGTAACMAGFFSNPFDVIKTRQQLQGELIEKKTVTASNPYSSVWRSFRSILKAEGVFGVQKGLVSALAFQFVMNSTRLGSYQTADNLGWTRDRNGEISTLHCIVWGGVSGIVGSSLGCPLYMIKTQIQAQSYGKYAVGFQHHHTGTISALRRIYMRQGVKGLWRGCSSIIPRTMVASSAQLATFSKCKEFVQHYTLFEQSVFLTALFSSMVSGFFACICMTPFDVIATRMFNQGVDANGKGLLYSNIIDCFIKTFKAEGVKGLYKGFVPNYWRVAPHTVLNLTFWEQLKKWHQLYLSHEGNVYFE